MFVMLVCEHELMLPSSVRRTDGSSEENVLLPVDSFSAVALARKKRDRMLLFAAEKTSYDTVSDTAFVCVMSGVMSRVLLCDIVGFVTMMSEIENIFER